MMRDFINITRDFINITRDFRNFTRSKTYSPSKPAKETEARASARAEIDCEFKIQDSEFAAIQRLI